MNCPVGHFFQMEVYEFLNRWLIGSANYGLVNKTKVLCRFEVCEIVIWYKNNIDHKAFHIQKDFFEMYLDSRISIKSMVYGRKTVVLEIATNDFILRAA